MMDIGSDKKKVCTPDGSKPLLSLMLTDGTMPLPTPVLTDGTMFLPEQLLTYCPLH